MRLAQTNQQLFDELLAADWSEDDLLAVRGAYELSTSLHVARLRASGKPFLNHVVGTASAIARAHPRVELVAAALLHAAYQSGDFGDGRRGVTPGHRAELTAAVGPEVEALVECFTRRGASIEDFHRMIDDAATLDDRTRDAARLRMANAVDNWVDHGATYRGVRRAHDDRFFVLLLELADRLGEDQLAALMREARGDGPSDDDVRARLAPAHRSSFTVKPRSMQYRARLRLRSAARRLRRS